MSPAITRIATDVEYNLLQFCRSRQSVFFVLVFPVLLLLVLGYLFGSPPAAPVLYYADNDGSAASQALVRALSVSGAVDLRDGAGMDLPQSLKDGSAQACLEIPPGFGNSSGATLTLDYDRSMSDPGALLAAVARGVDHYNLERSGVQPPVTLSPHDVATADRGYVDFLLPGILGICIMFAAVNETVGAVSRSQASGALRKLFTTPMSTVEWNVARLIAGAVFVLLSVAVSLAAAWLAFGCAPEINALSVLALIAGAITFTGLGLLIAQLFEGLRAVNAAIYIVTLPLILISGSLFPVEQLPSMLQFLSILSPLTYLTDGLRSAMFGGDPAYTIANLLIIAFLCIMLLLIGTAIMMGKEGHDV